MNNKEKEIKNRKILKVKQPNEIIIESNSIKIETQLEKPKEGEKTKIENTEENNENPNQVRLEELLEDLKLDDDDNDPNIIKENESIVEDFIKQMDNVKISKE